MHGEDHDAAHSVDLHGLAPPAALRRLSQEVHACRVRGVKSLLVITGRGWGNREQRPKLRLQVEAWLGTPEAVRMGVRGRRIVAKGGALLVEIGT